MISIVMACYNQGNFIKDAINSILSQTYKEWEIIIVEDGSTDDSLKTIFKFVKEISVGKKITITSHKQNEGYGSSLKDGISVCDGDLIAIVDSDDALFDNDVLKTCVNTHISNLDVSLTYSNYYECDKKLNPVKLYKTKQIPEGKTFLDGGIRVSHLKVFKRYSYLLTEGINPVLRQSVDKDLILKMEEVGKLLFIDKPLYKYRKHSSNISLTIDKKDKEYQEYVSKMRKQIYNDAKKRRGIIK